MVTGLHDGAMELMWSMTVARLAHLTCSEAALPAHTWVLQTHDYHRVPLPVTAFSVLVCLQSSTSFSVGESWHFQLPT